MPRKNRNPHPLNSPSLTDRYDVDYIFLPDAPEIAAVVAPAMKTIFRNMSCAPWADETHVAKGENDKYLAQIRRMF